MIMPSISYNQAVLPHVDCTPPPASSLSISQNLQFSLQKFIYIDPWPPSPQELLKTVCPQKKFKKIFNIKKISLKSYKECHF